jgi:hypothetical protein
MKWLNTICSAVNSWPSPSKDKCSPFSLQNLLLGYHWQYVPSLVAAMLQAHSKQVFDDEKLVRACVNSITWMLKPEGFLRIMRIVAAPLSSHHYPLLASFARDYLSSYYCSSLLEFLSKTLPQQNQDGIRLIVYTQSPSLEDAQTIAESIQQRSTFTSIDVASISSQTRLVEEIADFWKSMLIYMFSVSPVCFSLFVS